MRDTIKIGGLNVDAELYALIKDEIIPGTKIELENFWNSFEEKLKDLGPKNLACLQKRDELQVLLDAWYFERRGQDI
ncbi:MAG: hypothetical protein PF437_05980, partial [Sulfurimonas sp.]|nr:hypothetical protein [Sulfurimonas sp.]